MSLLRWLHGLRTPALTRGFAIVELVTVAALVGTMIRIAIPNVHELVLQARAAEVGADVESIRLAAVTYYGDRLAWPADAHTGQVPAELVPYLPEGFDFDGPGYRLDWEHWTVPDGFPGDADSGFLLAVSVVTDDLELGQSVADLLGPSTASWSLGNAYTFVLARY